MSTSRREHTLYGKMCNYGENHNFWKQDQPLASSVKPKDKGKFEKGACNCERDKETYLGFDQRLEIRLGSKSLMLVLRDVRTNDSLRLGGSLDRLDLRVGAALYPAQKLFDHLKPVSSV